MPEFSWGRITPQDDEDFTAWLKRISSIVDESADFNEFMARLQGPVETVPAKPAKLPPTPTDWRAEMERTGQLPKYLPEETLGGEWTPIEKAAGARAVKGLTLGLVKPPAPQVEGAGYNALLGAVDFGTFLTTPLGVAKWATKPIVKGVGALGSKFLPKVTSKVGPIAGKKIGEWLAQPAVLGTASALSDVQQVRRGEEGEPGMLDRFASGALTGAIFNVGGLAHIAKQPALSWLMRIGAVEALQAVAGRYKGVDLNDPEFWKTEGSQFVFDRLLDGFFTKNGVSPKELLDNTLPPEVARFVNRVKSEAETVNAVNKRLGLPTRIPLPQEVAQGMIGRDTAAQPALAEVVGPPMTEAQRKVTSWRTKQSDLRLQLDTTDDPVARDSMKSQIADLQTRIDAYGPRLKKEGKLPDGTTLEETVANSRFVQSVDTFFFNVQNGRVTALSGVRAGSKPPQNSLKLRRDPQTGEIELLDRGKGVKRMAPDSVQKNLDKADAAIKSWMKSPRGTIGLDTVVKFAQELRGLELPVDTLPSYLALLDINPEKITIAEWARASSILDRVKDLPRDQRMDALMVEAGKTTPEQAFPKFKDPAIEKAAQEKVVLSRQRHVAATAAALRQGGPGGAMTKLLTLALGRRWQDIRFTFQALQETTRIPFYEAYKPIERAKRSIEKTINELMKPLLKVGYLSDEDNQLLRDYYNLREELHLTTGIPIPEDMMARELSARGFGPKHQEAVKVIDHIFETISPMVRKYRFMRWYRDFYVNGGKTENGKDARSVFKQQKQLTPRLREIATIYEMAGETALDAQLAAETFGTISAGNYLPRVILGGNFDVLGGMEGMARSLDSVSDFHFKSRADEKSAIAEFYSNQMARKALPTMIQSYLRHVLNANVLAKPMADLQRILDPFARELTQSAPSAAAHSTADLLLAWSSNLKGFPAKEDFFQRMVTGTIKGFFRVFPLKPYVSFRNLFQDFVTAPHKRILYKSFLNGDVKWKNLPEADRAWAEESVMEFDPIQHDFLMVEAASKYKKYPGLRQYLEFAEWAGRFYPLTDRLSRRWSFAAMFTEATNRIADYRLEMAKAKTPQEQAAALKGLRKALGLDMLKTEEFLDFHKLLDAKEDNAAARMLGKWESDNTNYLYGRTEKSLEEQLPGSRSWTNLMTFSRGVVQQVANAAVKIKEGTTDATGRVKPPTQWSRSALGGTAFLASTAVAGFIVDDLLSLLANNERKKYSDYGLLNMMMWEIGGVGVDVVVQASQAVSEAIGAMTSGTPQAKEQALAKLAVMADNVAGRQFAPFLTNALGMLESALGYSYIEPIQNILYKATGGAAGKYPGKVDRTVLESIQHAIFLKDPNKSPDVLRNTIILRDQHQQAALAATNAASRIRHQYMAKRMAFIAEKLKRYQPMKPLDLKEWEEWNKTLRELRNMEDEMLKDAASSELSLNELMRQK